MIALTDSECQALRQAATDAGIALTWVHTSGRGVVWYERRQGTVIRVGSFAELARQAWALPARRMLDAKAKA